MNLERSWKNLTVFILAFLFVNFLKVYQEKPDSFTKNNSSEIKFCENKAVNYESEASDKMILIPVLIWGPNNQLQGFRESVFIAKALNRSIAAPLFHPNWNQHSFTAEASLRLDIQSLSEITSMINPVEVSKLCDGVVTAIFETRDNGDNHLHIVLEYYGLILDDKVEIFNNWYKKKQHKNLEWSEEYQNGKFTDAINKEILKENFTTNKKCAILMFPWSTILHQDISNQALLDEKQRKPEFKEMIEIIDHTRRPDFLRKAVAKFLREHKIRKFAVMHWRYDIVS